MLGRRVRLAFGIAFSTERRSKANNFTLFSLYAHVQLLPQKHVDRASVCCHIILFLNLEKQFYNPDAHLTQHSIVILKVAKKLHAGEYSFFI